MASEKSHINRLPLRDWGWLGIVGLCIWFVSVSTLPAQEGTSQQAPRMGPLRYTEDWSFLADNPGSVGWPWEPIKYISLAEGRETFLTLGGESRIRHESYRNVNWGEEPSDPDGYWWYRALPYADLHTELGPRVFGEMIFAPTAGVEPEPLPIDENTADFVQGFVEIPICKGESGYMRGGRSIVGLGSERLISTRYGPNVPRPFDGVRCCVKQRQISFDSFYLLPVDNMTGAFDDKASRTQQIYGAYCTIDVQDTLISHSRRATLDLYYIGFQNDLAIYQQGIGEERRHTLAARSAAALHGGLSWDWEFFYQFGDFAGLNISAWSLGTETKWQPQEALMHPIYALRCDFISGDRNRNDNQLNTFNPLFPKLRYFGETGVVAPYNLIDLHPAVIIPVTEKFEMNWNADFFWRESDEDALYTGGGRILRAAGNNLNRYIGTQYTLELTYAFNRNWEAFGAFAMIPAGQFIRESGASETIYFSAGHLKLIF